MLPCADDFNAAASDASNRSRELSASCTASASPKLTSRLAAELSCPWPRRVNFPAGLTVHVSRKLEAYPPLLAYCGLPTKTLVPATRKGCGQRLDRESESTKWAATPS